MGGLCLRRPHFNWTKLSSVQTQKISCTFEHTYIMHSIQEKDDELKTDTNTQHTFVEFKFKHRNYNSQHQLGTS